MAGAARREVRVYEWALRRIPLADGTDGVACYYHDVTRIQQAGAIVAETAARDAFLVAFSDAVRTLTDARDITLVAAELLGKRVAANQVFYAEIDPDAGAGAVVHEWSDAGGPLVTGALRLGAVGPEFLAELGRGNTVVVEDVAIEPIAGPLETFERRSVRSFVAVPLVKDDRFVAVLAAVQRTPRHWLGTEVALVEEVAERTWSAVERARAESALRETNRRLQLALDASSMGAFVWYPAEDRTEPDARMLDAVRSALRRDDQSRHRARAAPPSRRSRALRGRRRAGDGSRRATGALREDIRVLHPGGLRWIADHRTDGVRRRDARAGPTRRHGAPTSRIASASRRRFASARSASPTAIARRTSSSRSSRTSSGTRSRRSARASTSSVARACSRGTHRASRR